MSHHRSTRILAIAIALLLFASRENLAQDVIATPGFEKDSNEPEKSYVIPALEIVGFDFALNRFSSRYVDRDEFDVSWSSIRRNLKSNWVVDNDEFATNQFLHPYQGAIYHTASRSAGLGYWTSAIYTFAGSALWEIAGETTRPSRNDQIASGIGGSFFGEPLFRMANLVLERDRGVPRLGRLIGAAAISPATGLNRLAFGERFDPIFPSHEPAFFTQWNFGSTVAEYRRQGASQRSSRKEIIADFSMSYRRPFDQFNFEFTATTSNIFENIMTRGLLAGRGYSAGERYRGVWGLYGTYDYMAPDLFRVSSTGLSVGTTGQWGLPGPFTFQGSALGGMGYGAGGTLEGTGDRDYHYGLTPQGLVAARLVFGKAVSLDLTGRGYHITQFVATNHRGWEKIGRADASVTVRLFGPHAITVKYLLTRRLAHYPDLGDRDQRRGALSVFYTLVGDTRLGTVDWTPR
jgi:Domain of unknown function (DUF3943)